MRPQLDASKESVALAKTDPPDTEPLTGTSILRTDLPQDLCELVWFRSGHNKKSPAEPLVPPEIDSKTCARGDLNPHALSDTGT